VQLQNNHLWIVNLLNDASAKLKDVAQRPQNEAKILLSYILDVEQIWFITHSQHEVTNEQYNQFSRLVERRVGYEPIEYITNRVSFYSHTFFIKEGALIPRPETEILVDLASKYIKPKMKIAEVGVGSGALSVTLCKLHSDITVIATDISEDALFVARKNIKDNHLEEQITLINTDLLEGVEERLDIIISNPPYIANECKLEVNLDYEPSLALYGGDVGDEFLLRLINEAISRKIKFLLCEMGFDQRESIQRYCKERAVNVEFYKDLSGLDRGFIIEF